ncbi:hypothetical protein ACA910_016856 [Epithemia clementina (nom. ined.)]
MHFSRQEWSHNNNNRNKIPTCMTMKSRLVLVFFLPNISSAFQQRGILKDWHTSAFYRRSSKKTTGEDASIQVPSWATSAAAASIMCFCSILTPLPSNAASPSSVFNHDYADPLHPFCNRKIEVLRDGKSFHFSGTSVGAKDDTVLHGCSSEEIKLYKLRNGEFDGLILDDGYRISAGDGIHEGVWEPKNTATSNLGYEDVDGIRWNDGNKWIVKSQSYVQKSDNGNTVVKKPLSIALGEFIFLSYIGFSTLAGAYGLIKGIQQQNQKLS